MILPYNLFSLNLHQYLLLFFPSTLISILCVLEFGLRAEEKPIEKLWAMPLILQEFEELGLPRTVNFNKPGLNSQSNGLFHDWAMTPN